MKRSQNNQYQKGAIIKFGAYDWRVLTVQDGKALLLLEKVFESRRYHTEDHPEIGITWAECELRTYLNEKFYNKFRPQDRARIVETLVTTNNNPWHNTDGGKPTRDKIFLLSIEEVLLYFGDSGKFWSKKEGYWFGDGFNSARIAKPYNEKSHCICNWWLRTPGEWKNTNACVRDCGSIDVTGPKIKNDFYIRPALWLKISDEEV